MQIIFIKLGGSLLTDKEKPLSVNTRNISKLVNEIRTTRSKHPELRWIVGTGAGSFGHYMVEETGFSSDNQQNLSIAKIHNSVVHLNSIVRNRMIDVGIPSVSLPPISFAKYNIESKVSINSQSIFDLLKMGLVVLVHGDIITDRVSKTKIISTEKVMSSIARSIVKNHDVKAKAFIYATSTGGVMDSSKKIVPRINDKSKIEIYENRNFDVTGGMAEKILSAKEVLKYGDVSYIISGLNGSIDKALMRKNVGTRVVK